MDIAPLTAGHRKSSDNLLMETRGMSCAWD